MDKPSDFFSTVPFARDLDSNKFVVELSDLQANRIALLRCKIPCSTTLVIKQPN